MYKVFIENRCLKIIPSEQIQSGLFSEKNMYSTNNEHAKMISDWFTGIEQNDIFVISELPPNILIAAALPSLKFVIAAGGFVYNVKDEILFFQKNGCWDLPKGHCEKHESTEAAAIREVSEETGLKNPSIHALYGSSWHCYFFKGKPVLKQTFWYKMTSGPYTTLQADESEGITNLRWINQQELKKILSQTYRSLREFTNEIDIQSS